MKGSSIVAEARKQRNMFAASKKRVGSSGAVTRLEVSSATSTVVGSEVMETRRECLRCKLGGGRETCLSC